MSKDAKVNELVEALSRASDQYYNQGDSFLTDAEYDALERELRALDPSNTFLLGVGSDIRGAKVRLPYVMPSLDQVYAEDIGQWIADNKLDDEKLIVSDKLDGTSVMLVYNQKGELQIAFTRGNGVEGQDVTRHVRKMRRAPLKVSGKMVVRAEVILAEDDFQSNKALFEAQGKRAFKNSRNFAAGQMNSEEAVPGFYDHAYIVGYEVLDLELSKKDQLVKLHAEGFTTADWSSYTGKQFQNGGSKTLVDYVDSRIRNSSFTLDGVVIDVDNISTRKALAAKKSNDRLNPAYARKFKIVTEENLAITKVVSVNWKASKRGYLKPTITVEPVELMGVTVVHATAFNAKFISENTLGPGAVVELIRSGDVIPYITKVITPAPAGAYLPDEALFGTYTWNETEVDLVLTNPEDNDDVGYQSLLSSSKLLGVDFLGSESLRKLYDGGFRTIGDVIICDEATLAATINSKVMAGKVRKSIEKQLANVSLSVLGAISGAFGSGMGEKRLRNVFEAYGKLTDLTLEQIHAVDGFSNRTAPQVLEGAELFERFLAKIAGHYTLANTANGGSTAPTGNKKAGKLTGTTWVFTGFRDKDLAAKIEAVGGVVADGISKTTTHLVAKDATKVSGKMKKALDMGIKVLSINEVIGEI